MKLLQMQDMDSTIYIYIYKLTEPKIRQDIRRISAILWAGVLVAK